MKYPGDDKHWLEYEDGTIRTDCWCKPELVELDGDNYWLHKDKNGKTILTDPKLNN